MHVFKDSMRWMDEKILCGKFEMKKENCGPDPDREAWLERYDRTERFSSGESTTGVSTLLTEIEWMDQQLTTN